MDLPKTTKRLLLNDNLITSIPAFGLFNRLPNLQTVDLSRNKISAIEEGAFEGANSITEMCEFKMTSYLYEAIIIFSFAEFWQKTRSRWSTRKSSTAS